MFALLRQAVLIFVALTLITGVAYPLLVTGIAQIVFPHQANGSLIVQHDKVVGSELIGQQFDDPKYFWGRPSATSPAYNGAASTGSNFGPTNPAQLDAVRDRVESLRKSHPDQQGPIPVDLVTASGSGLDPHVSPAAAEYQVGRVARARLIDVAAVRNLVVENTEGRTFGILGEPRVNVLQLNLALDELQSQTKQTND
jgi:K+-transporting ATPase ATPase C chain